MKTADTKVREQLKAIRSDLASLREERTGKRRERDAAKEAFPAASDGVSVSDLQNTQAFKDAMEATAALGQIDDKIADGETAERSILEMLGSSPDNDGHVASSNGDEPRRRGGAWSLEATSQMLQSSGEYQQALESGLFHSRNKFGTVNLGELMTREEFVAAIPGAPAGVVDTATGTGYIAPDFRGVTPPALKQLKLLDMIPKGPTNSNAIEYVQVTGIPESAVETGEGDQKPQAGLTLADATAAVRTIPSYIKVNRQALADAAGLSTMINTLLPYDVNRRLESQILNGDGVGQNLKGILHQTGLGAPDAVAEDNTADAILRAMTTIVLSDLDPNFVTLNPLSWQNLLLMREGAADNSWRGEYLYGSPGMLQAPTIWGLSITTNRLISQSAPLVGDINGATLFVREGLNVRTSDADQDDFIRNRVTILAECRVALAVWRPQAFAQAAQG